MCIKIASSASLWLTYTYHLSDSEDAWQEEPPDRNGEDEDEGEGQRCLSGHNGPQRCQTHHLDTCEQVHPQRTHLGKAEMVRGESRLTFLPSFSCLSEQRKEMSCD